MLGILKIVGAAIAGIFILLTALALIEPTEYKIERTVVIEAPADAVFPLVGEIQQMERWSPWKAKDSTVKNSYEGPASGVGATQKWTSEKSGSGTLSFTEFEPNRRVKYKLVFVDMNSEATGEVILAENAGQTSVTWTMEGQRSFTEKMFWVALRVENAIQKDFDQGLGMLKNLVEKK